jgi:hypothetical protein
MFASRAACPISGTIFLLAFQPKGRSETPLYKENSRGLFISYIEFISDGSCLLFLEPLCRKDETLGGGVGVGAVVTEEAKDIARDMLVFLLSVIVQIFAYHFCYLSVCVTHAKYGRPPVVGLTGDRRANDRESLSRATIGGCGTWSAQQDRPGID